MASGPNLLTGDSVGFEGGTIGGWQAQNVTIANSTAQAHNGNHSLSITALQTSCTTTSPFVIVTPGSTYTIGFWERAGANTGFIVPQMVYFDAAGANVVGNFPGTGATDSNTAWTFYTYTTVAPAAAGTVKLYCSFFSVTINDVHYLDDASIALTGATPTFTNWRLNSLSFSGLPQQTVRERSLSALASMASGQNPDGTIKGS